MPIEDEADSLNIETGRSDPAEKTEENPLDKGKSSSRARYSPFSGDIDLLVDRSEGCVNLQAKGKLLKKPFKRLQNLKGSQAG
jgi:hypothetical protein